MDGKRKGDLPYRKGVGAVLINRDGLVFVARRIDTPGDAWQLPQGAIEDGEKAHRAVLRELAEEIGTSKAEIIAESKRWYRYDLPEDLVGRVWGGKYRGQKQRWFALRFTGTDADINLAADGHPEFDAWRWVPIETLPALAVAFKRRLYEDLIEEFRHLAVPWNGDPRCPAGGQQATRGKARS
jgi:putative (di)nucleoside polyphosphate hydrolase